MRFLLFLPVVVQAVIRGISHYGLETDLGKSGCGYICCWANPLEFYVKTLHDLEFNSIRIPFSAEYVQEGNFSVMDTFFDLALQYDMNITLDFHRTVNSHQPFSPISEISLQDFLEIWYHLIERYESNPKFYAISVFNEYQGSNVEWYTSLIKNILMAIESKFPQRFVYLAGCINWSGNCAEVSYEDLPFADRILYAWHKYIFSSSNGTYEHDWNYSVGQYPTKIVLEEWGFKMTEEEILWANQFIAWLKLTGISSNFFWTIAHSGDTGGLFDDGDCTSINWNKYQIIKKLWT